jgi:hypothetical protein
LIKIWWGKGTQPKQGSQEKTPTDEQTFASEKDGRRMCATTLRRMPKAEARARDANVRPETSWSSPGEERCHTEEKPGQSPVKWVTNWC